MSEVNKVVVYQGPRGPTGATGPQWNVYGSAGSPEAITSAGITWHGSKRELHYVHGSGGPVVVSSAFPTSGAVIGDERRIVCLDPVNTLKLADGSGLNLDSDDVTLGTDGARVIDLQFNGVAFMEINRK